MADIGVRVDPVGQGWSTFGERFAFPRPLILCYNHPSGDPEPSEADIAMTKKIGEACDILGIALHDHIIVGADRETSLRSRGDL